jgi:hypothetical protein
MPITDALKTAKQLQQAGLPPAAAELLAEKFEETAKATQENLRDSLRPEFAALRQEFASQRAELNGKFAQLEGKFGEQEAKFERSLRTVTGILIAVISLAVAIIKLFPNWH